jgi:hypothetical protein
MCRGLRWAGLAAAAIAAVRAQPVPAPPGAPCGVQALNGPWSAAAQFLGGLDSGPYSALFTPEQQAAWTDFAKASSSDWRNLQKRYLDRIASWRTRALPNQAAGQTAFYPFGGPDAANLLAFFPDARDYVIIGLEPVGCIPSNVPDYTAGYFSELRQNLSSVVALGFFKTNEMGGNFKQGSVNGVLPLLLFLMARSGFEVTDAALIGITPTGAVVPAGPVKTETAGVAIQFRDQRHGARTLRYFALNLQNARLQRKPGTMQYLGNLPEPVTLVKSASYLMHKVYFSAIRGLILSKSRLVVEDDSGIPFHYFDPAAWDVRLYGVYTDPIKLFKNGGQDDLKDAFASRSDAQPLDFGIGYRRRGESNLLVAVRRGK